MTSWVLERFERTPLVSIGEAHQLLDLHRFLHDLVADPGFPDRVDDIVVEFGSAEHQDALDRYILGDHDADVVSIAPVWRDTTQLHGVWDSSLYRKFFALVRSLNRTLARERRIRVVAGDPPVKWSSLADQEVLRRSYQERDAHFASVVAREVLGKQRRALLLIGGAHLLREKAGTAAYRLVTTAPGSLSVVLPIVSDTAASAWRAIAADDSAPALLATRGSDWEGLPGGLLVPTADQWSVADIADAVLYLGAPPSFQWIAPDPSRDVDDEYCRVFRRRLLLWMSESLRASVVHPCVQ